MSKLRSVNTHFWDDNYVIDLDPVEKLLFLYLLTNSNTNMLGIYELHVRKISFDTGIDKEMVLKIFKRFHQDGKASYIDGYVALHNFTKHQSYNENMKKSAVNSFNELPEKVRSQKFNLPIAKGLEPLPKGYSLKIPKKDENVDCSEPERVTQPFTTGSEPIAEIEREYEYEREAEIEREIESSLSNPRGKTMYEPQVIAPPERIEKVIEIGSMKAIPAEQCEIYYHLRATDNFLRKDKDGNWKPILNWHSDLHHLYSKGALEPDNSKKQKNGTTKETKPANGISYNGDDLADFEFDESAG